MKLMQPIRCHEAPRSADPRTHRRGEGRWPLLITSLAAMCGAGTPLRELAGARGAALSRAAQLPARPGSPGQAARPPAGGLPVAAPVWIGRIGRSVQRRAFGAARPPNFGAQAGRRSCPRFKVPPCKVQGPAVQGSRSRRARFEVPPCKIQGSRCRCPRSKARGPRLGLPGPAVQGSAKKANPPRISPLAPASLRSGMGPLADRLSGGSSERGEEGWPRGAGARGGGSRARAGARARARARARAGA